MSAWSLIEICCKGEGPGTWASCRMNSTEFGNERPGQPDFFRRTFSNSCSKSAEMINWWEVRTSLKTSAQRPRVAAALTSTLVSRKTFMRPGRKCPHRSGDPGLRQKASPACGPLQTAPAGLAPQGFPGDLAPVFSRLLAGSGHQAVQVLIRRMVKVAVFMFYIVRQMTKKKEEKMLSADFADYQENPVIGNLGTGNWQLGTRNFQSLASNLKPQTIFPFFCP